jgi:hypothetical protein
MEVKVAEPLVFRHSKEIKVHLDELLTHLVTFSRRKFHWNDKGQGAIPLDGVMWVVSFGSGSSRLM